MPKVVSMVEIFQAALERGASDIHIAAGAPPMVRVNGVLHAIEREAAPLEREEAQKLTMSLLTSAQQERFQKERELDLSYQSREGTRFRINCHYERDNIGLVARIIPDRIPTLEEVHMPAIVRQFTTLTQGIVLFTGPTGSGKSTSLAALIEVINQERSVHVITLEDPIEFLYHSKKALIRQRQCGTDFLSFGEALRRIVRQDPNVILVGEMRDLETVGAALTLAETGHLVLGTLHTPNSAQTVDRIIDIFPSHQHDQIRLQLSLALVAVIAQRLVPRKGGGRCAVREVLLDTPAVANIIRDNRVAELPNVIQTSAEEGMITFERDMGRLYHEGLVERETAQQFVKDASLLEELAEKEEGKGTKKGWFGS
jgi:twitching motility protein PilT